MNEQNIACLLTRQQLRHSKSYNATTGMCVPLGFMGTVAKTLFLAT